MVRGRTWRGVEVAVGWFDGCVERSRGFVLFVRYARVERWGEWNTWHVVLLRKCAANIEANLDREADW